MQESHSSHLTTALCYRAADTKEQAPLFWSTKIEAFTEHLAHLLRELSSVKHRRFANRVWRKKSSCRYKCNYIFVYMVGSLWEWAAFDSKGLFRHRQPGTPATPAWCRSSVEVWPTQPLDLVHQAPFPAREVALHFPVTSPYSPGLVTAGPATGASGRGPQWLASRFWKMKMSVLRLDRDSSEPHLVWSVTRRYLP